jgi:glycosyltransferase involved in cell wall biosynthesis
VIDSRALALNAEDVAHRPVSEAKRISKALLQGWWHEMRLPKAIAGESLLMPPPLAPQAEPILVDGVVYTTVLNPADGRKNWVDIVSAFCWAFKNEPEATLIVKMTHHDINLYRGVLLTLLARLSPFRCRVLVLHGFLQDEEYLQLIQASTFYVNASSGEGLCLPLMEFLCCGKPAIAPRHTAMADYLYEDFAFIVRTCLEPSCWPHDPTGKLLTHSNRLNWQSLMEAYRTSYSTVRTATAYQHMSFAARNAMHRFCSLERVSNELGSFLQQVASSEHSNMQTDSSGQGLNA